MFNILVKDMLEKLNGAHNNLALVPSTGNEIQLQKYNWN